MTNEKGYSYIGLIRSVVREKRVRLPYSFQSFIIDCKIYHINLIEEG